MKTLHRILTFALLCSLASVAAALPAGDDERVGTVNAAAITQAVESAFDITLGGRLQTDFAFPLEREPFDGRFGRLESDMEVRRARLHVTGRMYDRLDYKIEVDFAGGKVGAKDLYLGLRGLPVGTRFGHFKEPFSLEELTSSRFMTFLERSLINVLAPSRNTGIQADGDLAGGRGTWAAGVFRDSDGFKADAGDNYGLTGRATWAPVQEDGGARLVHLGVSATRRWLDAVYAFDVDPADHTAPTFVPVAVPADSATALSLEAAANFGPIGLQGQYTSTSVRADGADDPRFHGYYLQAGWFLTGEHRPYDGGVFGRVDLRSDLNDGGGAWEVAARYARIDVTDAAPTAGEVWNLTLGVNWYWFSHFRWMLNYQLAGLADVEGSDYSSLQLRASLDF